MLNNFFYSICLFWVLFFCGFLNAQNQQFSVFQMRYFYNDAKFSEVINNGKLLLKTPDQLRSKDLQEIHKYLALAFFNISQPDSSRFHFYSLLSLNPDFELDPVVTSPKIISFFSDIKSSFNRSVTDQTAIKYKEYIFVEDIRPKSALRSMILPGWGQFYKQQDTKGYIFASAFLTTSIAAGITYMIEENRKDDYMKETDVSKISGRYDDYNNMSKIRKTLQYSAIAIWLVSITDALFTDYTPRVSVSEEGVAVSLNIQL